MADRVLFDMGRSVADSRITYAKILTYLSEARHQLQDKTNAVKCLDVIDLSEGSLTEPTNFQLSCSVRSVSMTEYRNIIDDDTIPWQPINQIPFEAYEQLYFSGSFTPNNQDPPRITGPQFTTLTVPIVSIFNNNLRVYPFTNTGAVRIQYIPHLPQYAPDDIVDWGIYGTSPASAMAINGPQTVFTPAIEGMISFAKVKMAMSFPAEFAAYASFIPTWQSEWERLAGKINTTQVQRSRRTPYSLGVLH